MITAVFVAIGAIVCFAAAGPSLTRVLPPAVAVRLLTPAVVVAAVSAVFVLSMVTFAWLGQLNDIAARGTWSPQTLHALDPIPRQVSVAAGFLLLPAAAWTIRTIVRTSRALWQVQRASRDLPCDASGITMLDSPQLAAYTTWSGRIIITRGMLSNLNPSQLQILLAHERSHRQHRHTWWNLIADLAAAINPLLLPTTRALHHTTERWADEDAASTANRRAVATTIAHVALLRTGAPTGTMTTASATGGQITERVRALLRPAPATRVRYIAAALALTFAVVAATIAVEYTSETLFELAAGHAATAAHR